MSSLYLSPEQFFRAAAEATLTTIQQGRGIVHRGPHANSPERRFNSRALQRNAWCEVRYFIDELPTGAVAVIFTTDGLYWGMADEKRAYYPQETAFHNALDFDPQALRVLYRNGPIGWHGRPWHEHLAAVKLSVMIEGGRLALPWSGNVKGAKA